MILLSTEKQNNKKRTYIVWIFLCKKEGISESYKFAYFYKRNTGKTNQGRLKLVTYKRWEK